MPLRQERESLLRLQTLWQTPLTPKHILQSYVRQASDTAAMLSGSQAAAEPLTWVPFQLDSFHSMDNVTGDDDSLEWQDVPDFEASHEILGEVIADNEEGNDALEGVDATWCASASNIWLLYNIALIYDHRTS